MEDQGITIDDAIEFLNGLIELDKPAIATLIANQVPCNKELANHPTVQVWEHHGGFTVSAFGLLNGLFGTLPDGRGKIMYVFEDGNLIRFERTPEGCEALGQDSDNTIASALASYCRTIGNLR